MPDYCICFSRTKSWTKSVLPSGILLSHSSKKFILSNVLHVFSWAGLQCHYGPRSDQFILQILQEASQLKLAFYSIFGNTNIKMTVRQNKAINDLWLPLTSNTALNSAWEGPKHSGKAASLSIYFEKHLHSIKCYRK